jgi:glycosyltransferase involved in cell wall biosynthesis
LVERAAPLSLLFVDDGSRDQTLAVLRDLASQDPDSIEVIALAKNQGKAEAVRQGLLHALLGSAEFVGFADADLATPASELMRLAVLARDMEFDVIMGARVQLLGRTIERKSSRHYLGRIFATVASLSLGLPVYDTQCGAKLFRRSSALCQALEAPFTSRWAFDVELLGRMLHPRAPALALVPERIREEPLLRWKDVAGSKLNPMTALWTGIELLQIGWNLRRTTRRAPHARNDGRIAQ